jgi:hypothetical protein
MGATAAHPPPDDQPYVGVLFDDRPGVIEFVPLAELRRSPPLADHPFDVSWIAAPERCRYGRSGIPRVVAYIAYIVLVVAVFALAADALIVGILKATGH